MINAKKIITWAQFVKLCRNYSLIDDNSGILLTPDFLLANDVMESDKGRMNINQNDDNGSYHYATFANSENKEIEVVGCSILLTEPDGKVFSLVFVKSIDDPLEEVKNLK